MNDKTGGPAFPSEGGHKFVSGNEIRKTLPSSGMTLRDYFAIHVDSNEIDRYVAGNEFRPEPISREKARYAIADRMLAERTK